jgi:hypothetical protein
MPETPRTGSYCCTPTTEERENNRANSTAKKLTERLVLKFGIRSAPPRFYSAFVSIHFLLWKVYVFLKIVDLMVKNSEKILLFIISNLDETLLLTIERRV